MEIPRLCVFPISNSFLVVVCILLVDPEIYTFKTKFIYLMCIHLGEGVKGQRGWDQLFP